MPTGEFFQQGANVYGFGNKRERTARFQTRHVQQFVDHIQQAVGVGLNRLVELLLDLFGQRMLLVGKDGLHVAPDRRQRVAQFMGHKPDEVRFQPARFFEGQPLRLLLVQRVLQAQALFQAAAQVVVQAGVLNGDGGLIGERRQHIADVAP